MKAIRIIIQILIMIIPSAIFWFWIYSLIDEWTWYYWLETLIACTFFLDPFTRYSDKFSKWFNSHLKE